MSSNLTLQLEKLFIQEDFPLIQEQKDILAEIIEWRAEPPIVKTGRSTFLMIQDNSLPFKGIKIKGCGYFDVHKKIALQPSTKEGYDAHIQNMPDGVKEIHYQIEVNDKDEIVYSIPEKRPYGAQLYSKAKLEYEVNKRLLKEWQGDAKKYPFYLPIGYAKYKDLKYKDEPLGVTILGTHSPTEIALGEYFMGQFEDKGLRLNPHLLKYCQNHVSTVGKTESDYFDLLMTLKKLSKEFGKSLSHLHDYYVDFDSHLFNATVNQDSGNVILYDFDHVHDVAGLSDQAYFYHTLKDFEIALVTVLSNFLLSGLIDGINLVDEMGKSIEDVNLIEGLFEGYFGKLSDEVKEQSSGIWDRMILMTMRHLLKSKKDKRLHLANEFCELEREESFIDIFPVLFEKIRKKRPNFDLSEEKHKSIIESFLKQKSVT